MHASHEHHVLAQCDGIRSQTLHLLNQPSARQVPPVCCTWTLGRAKTNAWNICEEDYVSSEACLFNNPTHFGSRHCTRFLLLNMYFLDKGALIVGFADKRPLIQRALF